jgi:hypothetical protein
MAVRSERAAALEELVELGAGGFEACAEALLCGGVNLSHPRDQRPRMAAGPVVGRRGKMGNQTLPLITQSGIPVEVVRFQGRKLLTC